MSTEIEERGSQLPPPEVSPKELTLGKFAAMLLGPALLLLVGFAVFSLANCGEDCESELAGANLLGLLVTLVVASRFGIYGVLDLSAAVSQKHSQTERGHRLKRGAFRLGLAMVLILVAYVWLVSQLYFA